MSRLRLAVRCCSHPPGQPKLSPSSVSRLQFPFRLCSGRYRSNRRSGSLSAHSRGEARRSVAPRGGGLPLQWAARSALRRFFALVRPMRPPLAHSKRSLAVLAATVAVAYYAGAEIGLALTFPPATTSILWPPNAILTVALLLVPVR